MFDNITRAPYRYEPYVRATLDDGTTVDGKANAWTDKHVLVTWEDRTTPAAIVDGIRIHRHHAWIPTDRVQRITKAESAGKDPYDLGD